MNNTFTAYIVNDTSQTCFLSNKAYAASTAQYTTDIGRANIFFSRRAAQSCASNINARGGEGMRVTPVEMQRRTKRR